MTEEVRYLIIAAWAAGMLVIASLSMTSAAWPHIRAEFHNHGTPWYRNRALLFSAALFGHGVGSIVLLLAPFGRLVSVAMWFIYLLSVAGGTLLWAAKMTVTHSLGGQLPLVFGLSLAWTTVLGAMALFWG